MGIVGSLVGVVVIFFGHVYEKEELIQNDKLIGVAMLVISACIQALEITLE